MRLALAACISSTLACQAYAEQAPALEEVIVTARKKAESLQEIPVAVSAFGTEQMEIKSVADLADIGALTAGLSLSNGVGHPASANVAIRGQSEVEAQLVLDPAVGVYIDGAYLGRSQALGLNLYDLERVEILKGPQGTLFGRNTTGGAVNITTKDPGEEFGGYVKATFGDYDRQNFQGAASIPLAENLAIRVAASTADRDGYIDNKLIGGEYGDENSEAYRFKLLWTPEDWEIRLSYDYAESDTAPLSGQRGASTACNLFRSGPGFSGSENFQVALSPACGADPVLNADPIFGPIIAGFNVPRGQAGTPSPTNPNLTYPTFAEFVALEARDVNDPYSVYEDTLGRAELEDWGTSLSIAREFENLTLKSITSYREIENFRLWDVDNSPYQLLDVGGGLEQDQFSQEFQILGDALDGSLEYVAGLYYFNEEGTDIVDINIGNTRALTAPLTPGGFWTQRLISDAKNESRAVFAQVNYTPPAMSDLTINLGWRRSKDDREVTARHRAFNAGTFSEVCAVDADTLAALGTGTCAATNDATFNGTSLLAGFNYQLTDNKMAYLKYSEGFRSGALQGRAGDLARFGSPIAPEDVIDYEIGFKGDWEIGDMALRTNIAAFYTEIENRQRSFTRTTTSGGTTTAVESAQEGEVKGWEIELLLLATDNLTFNASTSRAKAEHTKFIDSLGVDRSGEGVPQNPEYSYQAGFTYFNEVAAGGEFIWSMDYNWLDSQTFGFNPDSTTTAESYSLVNARIGWKNIANSGVSVEAWGKNLNDEEYFTGAVFLANQFGWSTRDVGEPRMYGLDVKYDF